MKRIEVLDVWRSLCVAIMVVYHGAYDLSLFGVLDGAAFSLLPVEAIKYLTLCSFLLISGIVSRFSQKGLKRGFFVFCVGLAVSVVTALAGMPVAFGILQFFGIAMMLYALLGKKIDALRGAWFPLACALLFAVTAYMTYSVTTDIRWLYPLGFEYPDFYSSDYYPIFPWIFVFLLGAWLGRAVEKRRGTPFFSKSFPAWTTFLGRHSLAVYVLHQPLLYGACLLLLGR